MSCSPVRVQGLPVDLIYMVQYCLQMLLHQKKSLLCSSSLLELKSWCGESCCMNKNCWFPADVFNVMTLVFKFGFLVYSKNPLFAGSVSAESLTYLLAENTEYPPYLFI